jgi:hypothetical protein
MKVVVLLFVVVLLSISSSSFDSSDSSSSTSASGVDAFAITGTIAASSHRALTQRSNINRDATPVSAQIECFSSSRSRITNAFTRLSKSRETTHLYNTYSSTGAAIADAAKIRKRNEEQAKLEDSEGSDAEGDFDLDEFEAAGPERDDRGRHGDADGLGDDLNVPWRVKGEEILHREAKRVGVLVEDVTWCFAKLKITVASDTSSSKIAEVSSAINEALMEVDDEIDVISRVST